MPNNQECKRFISEIAPIIQREAKKNGYQVCSPVIAQACIESRYGLSGTTTTSASSAEALGRANLSTWQPKRNTLPEL